MKIRYFDLGLYKCKELLWMKDIMNSLNIDYEIYGFEGCKKYYENIKNLECDNIKLYNYLISKDHNVNKNLYYSKNGVGHSIYKSKNNVSKNNFEITKSIKFSEWINEENINLNESFNIIKINIEGAEWDFFNDIIDSGIRNKIDIFCGQGHDVEKIDYFKKNNIIKKYWELLFKNNIKILRFSEYMPNKNVNMKEIILEKINENKIKMRKTIGDGYNNYEDYLKHQKEKTCDPKRRKIWLGKEWDMKIKIFEKMFLKLKSSNIIKENDKCLCLGARTGQEVVALNNIGMNALGIDIVPNEPYVILGDIHNLEFEDKTFDFCFTNIVDHSLYPDKFMNEIERVLKPNGKACIQLQLQNNINSDKYSVNDVYKADEIINLFNQSKIISNKKIPFTLSMNWQIIIQKV